MESSFFSLCKYGKMELMGFRKPLFSNENIVNPHVNMGLFVFSKILCPYVNMGRFHFVGEPPETSSIFDGIFHKPSSYWGTSMENHGNPHVLKMVSLISGDLSGRPGDMSWPWMHRRLA